MMTIANNSSNPTARRKEPTGKVSIDQLAKALDLPDWDRVREINADYIAESGHQVADDPNDEESRFSAEQKAEDGVFRSWYDAVLAAASSLYGEHGLELAPIPVKGAPSDARSYDLRVVPSATWQDAARKLVETINGAGPFHYANAAEFISCTGGTARRSVLSHLHWIAEYPAVYGTRTALRIYEGAWS